MSDFEAFVLGYLVNSAWQVPLICLAAYACARLVRRMGPQAEQRVWVTALLAAAVLPACAMTALSLPFGFGSHAADGIAGVQVEVGKFTLATGTALHLPSGLRHGVVAIYLALALFFCGRLAWGLMQSERLRRRSRKLELTAEWQAVWERCCQNFDVHNAKIACTPGIAGPLTLGFRRRMLLLPPDFMETAEAHDVEAALGHELAHMRRRDFAKNVLYELISLPVSYHPMTRWLKAQVRQSRELVCDAMAAELVTTKENYARSLLRLASLMTNRTQAVPVHAIGIFDANILERRIMNLTTKAKETGGLLRVSFAAACVLVGIATCGSALALRLDVNEPPPPATVAQNGPVKVANAVMAGSKIGGKNPTYPAHARKAHVEGTVVLHAVISKTGDIKSLQITSGPEALRESAMEAVRTWRYRPFLLNGEPTEVETTIQVNYNMGG